jgi:hypothetical protein
MVPSRRQWMSDVRASDLVRRDPKTPSMLTGKGAHAGVLAEVVEVLHRGDPARHDPVPAGALERGQLTAPTRRTRNCFHAAANRARSSRAGQPGLPAVAQPS